MFDGIVAEPAICDYCSKRRLVAHIPPNAGAEPYMDASDRNPMKLCSSCIGALQRLAYYLRRLEAEPPKKPRKRATRQPRAIAPYVGPSKHEVSSLVPDNGDHVSTGQPDAMS